jgi:hypothetical protein
MSAVLGLPSASMAADPGARALEQERLQRQQQQEALQLRMQQDNVIRSAPADARQKRAIEESDIRRRQRQDAVHSRQSAESPAVQPSDDEGTRQAKEAIRREAAGRESRDETRQPGSGVPGGK